MLTAIADPDTVGDGAVAAAGLLVAACAGIASKMDFLLPPLARVMTKEVVIKIPAKAAVNFVKKFAPPELPKIVWLDPPNAPPKPPPSLLG